VDKISEIKAAVDKFQKDTAFIALRRRWDNDFDLWRLKPYDAGRGYYSYTSNAPKNLAKKSISMLTEAKLLIRIPGDVLTEPERSTASNVERFLYGAINLNDEQLMRQPDMPPLQNQMAWYATIRGGFAVRPYIKKLEDGSTFPEIAVWDIYNVAYGIGKEGRISWIAHTYKMSKEAIKDEFDITIGKEIGNVVDFWDTKSNGIIVENQWGKKLEKHLVDYCPAFILRTGSMPPVWQEHYQDTGKHIGESIFDANRLIYSPTNKTISDLLTMVRRGVKVPLGYWSAGATKTLDEDIWQVEKAGLVPMDSNTSEKIAPLIEPTMPADASGLLNIMSGEEQRGGLSHVAQGELGFRLSGFAINQLQAALSTLVVPFAEAMERAYTVSCISLLEQYSKGGWKPVEVRGRTSRNQPFGIPKSVKIAPSDIEGTWHPEIRLEPTLPKDDAQRYFMARQATEGDRPLLSMETARDALLEVQDTNLESEKVAKEWADTLPIIRLWKAFMAALADNDIDLAQNIIAELRRLMGGAMPGAAGGTQPSTSLEQQAAGMPGVSMPSGETGAPPNVMPSESLGGLPGGAMNAQMPLEGMV